MRKASPKIMKKSVRNLKNLVFVLLTVWVFMVSMATAFAAITVFSPEPATTAVTTAQIPDHQPVSKTFAPEPATLALFGSGFLGMFMSFVRRTYAAAKRMFD